MATISSSETFAKRRAVFLSVRKTVNIQGYSKLQEPFITRENCYPLISYILNQIISIVTLKNRLFLKKQSPGIYKIYLKQIVMFAILSDRNKYLTLCSVPIAVKIGIPNVIFSKRSSLT